VTTNAAPQPANAMPIPAGFNPANPDLAALFAALPTNTAAVPTATIAPTRFVAPYNEVLRAAGGVRVGGCARERYWLPEQVSAAGGVRVGGSLREVDLRITSTRASVAPGLVTMTISGGTSAGPALLLRFDGGFTDSSLNGLTVTNNGATIDTTDPKFGSGCALFSGADTYAKVTGAPLAVGGGSWTLGLWVKTPESGDIQVIAMIPGDTLAGLQIENGVAAWFDATTTYASKAVPDDEWCYIEVAKEGNTLRLFVDGVKSSLDMAVESFHTTNNITAQTLYLGAAVFDDGMGGETPGDMLTGRIDDLFLLPGQALHTANFTPPTAPYPSP
jgi:hypothetical protein